MSVPRVSLWEVVEARGGSLTENEIWALLAAAVTTIQDTTLSGEGLVGVITPEGLVLRRCGRVDLVTTPAHSPAHPHGNYMPPEAFCSTREQNHEGILVFSLGRTLWTVTEHGSATTSSRSSDGCANPISSSLRSTLAAMTHNVPAHRLSLIDIFQLLVERLDGRDRLNYTATIRSLYEEVLGPSLRSPQPQDHFTRERSYSALDAKSSSAKRLSRSPTWSTRKATSSENLHHPQLSFELRPFEPIDPVVIDPVPSSQSSFNRPQSYTVNQSANTEDMPMSVSSSNSTSGRGFDCHQSLWKSKLHFRSVDSLSLKENFHPNGCESRRLSFLGRGMNPIEELSPQKSVPLYGSQEIRSATVNSQCPESRTSVTVSRSATVAGVVKIEISGFVQAFRELLWNITKGVIYCLLGDTGIHINRENLPYINSNTEVELNQNQNEEVPSKRRMVVRTPSRLYRFASNSLNVVKGKSGLPLIIGPEFVVRSKEPVTHLSLVNSSQVQRGVVKRVTVILVTGRRIELTCDPAVVRVSHVLQAVLEEEKLPLPHLLGLAVLGSGEFHFVAPQTKLHKVAPPGWKERHPTKDGLIQDNFTLHLRIIYYLKFNNVKEMDGASRQLLFLQLRHDMLEGRLPVSSNVLMQLAALALQAEFGDQRKQEGGYFLPEHYVPESLLRGGQASKISDDLQKLHKELSSHHYTLAQTQFINIIQDTLHYGTHFYHVSQDKGRQQCWLGIGRDGVVVVGDGPPSPETLSYAALHPWSSVKRLSYASHRLTIAVRGPDRTLKIKFNLQENRSRHVFYLATVHQSFHRDVSTTTNLNPDSHHSGITQFSEESTVDNQYHTPSSTASVTTTARTSLSSAGTGDEPHSCGNPEGVVVPGETHVCEKLVNGPTILKPKNIAASVDNKPSDVLSRANFLADILWRGGGDESDEVFSIENLENEHQFHLQTQQHSLQEEEKLPFPRVFHQRSKSNIEDSSLGIKGASGIRPELSREFGSDESLLKSPKKGTTVRMGTRVSAAALQKHRMRSLEGLVKLPSLEELSTSPTAIVVEPSIRSVVVEESVSESLVERFSKCPAASGPERRLCTVTLQKKDGSLGVMIAEGIDHGIYIQAISPGGPADEQGLLKPGDRIVGINGRSVENLPYIGAVDLLRQIDTEVTLLVSQPVTSSPSPGGTPAEASSSASSRDARGQQQRPPEGTTDDNNAAGHGGGCAGVNDCDGKGEKGYAKVQAVGGARAFIREVRSGPVTVITVNTDPSAATQATSVSTHSTPTHTGNLKQVLHFSGIVFYQPMHQYMPIISSDIKSQPPTPSPRPSLSSSSSSATAPSESSNLSSKLSQSVQRTRSLYHASLVSVQNGSFDFLSVESGEVMGSHNQQATAPALSKDTKVFNINTPCTTDDDRWIVKENENKNKPYKQYQAVFDVEPSCKETLNQGEHCTKTTSKSMITDEASCKNPYSLDDLICPRTEKTAIVNNLVSNSLSEHTNNSLSKKVHALTDYGTKRLTRTNSASELTRCSVSNDSKCLQEINKSLWKKMKKSEVSEVSEVSKSSSHSSLVPCQGSSECLEQCPKQSVAFDNLPRDTMLDRVLRCFEPFGVLKPQDTLVSRVSNLETAKDPPIRQYPTDKTSTEYWDKHHEGPDNWKPDLFFKDFSLEEQQFPDSEHGSISSAADQCRLLSDFSVSSLDHEISPVVSQMVSCTSPDIHTARYVAEIPSPVDSEENFIITPPEEFQGTDTLELLPKQHSHLDMECIEKEKKVDIPHSKETEKPLEEESLQDLKPINDSAEERDPKPPDIIETTGKFRLITESEYLRAVEYKEDTSISLDDRVESHSNTPPECSLSNLEHPLRAAYLRKLLLENQDAEDSSSQSPGIEEDICIDTKESTLVENEASLIKSFSITTKKHKDGKLWNNDIVPKSEGKTESVAMTDYMNFSDSTEYDEKSVNVHKLLEPFTPKDLRLEYQNVPNKGEMTSNLPVQNKPAGGLSDMRALSATSSGSSGTPPPVDFATHPLSLSDLHTKETCSKQVEVNADMSELGDRSVTLNSSNDCLTSKDKCSQLHRMYPEIDSDSEEENGTPKANEKGNADCSNESEESEEVELFINNPESMVISQINLQPEPNTYEALLLELESKKFSLRRVDSSRLKEPDDTDKERSPSSQASPTPSTDGWGIGAKNLVSDEILSLDGEDFASYLEEVVKDVETQPWESEEAENFEFLRGEQIPDDYQDKECKEDESYHQALDGADLNSCSEAASKSTNHSREETLHDKITEAAASLKTTRPFFLPKEEPSVTQKVSKDPPFFQVKRGFETFFTSVCIDVSDPKERSLCSDKAAAVNTGHAKKTFCGWESYEEISTDAEFQGRKTNQVYHHSGGKDTPITKYKNSPHIVTLKVKYDKSDEVCKRLDVIPERFEDIPLRCAERDNPAIPFEDSPPEDDPAGSQSRGHYPSSCMMYDGASDSSSSSPTAESPELSWSEKKGETEYQFSTTPENSQKTELVLSKGETKHKGIVRCAEMKSSFDENTSVDVSNGKRSCVLVSSKIKYGNLNDNGEAQHKDPSSKYRVTNNKKEEGEDYLGPDLQSVEAARTRNVVGTFNFLERGSPDNLYVKNSDEQPDSFGDSFVSVNEGITSLGTFNFVGRLDSAPKASIVNNRPAEEEAPSLSDSLISLEDGKHLLGVFDFTKSSSNKLPLLVRGSEEPANVSGGQLSKKSETDGLTDLCEGNTLAVISQRHVSHRSESEDIEGLHASREPTSEKTFSKEENDVQGDQTPIFDINCLSRRETGVKPEDFESIEIISAKSLNKEEGKEPITDSLCASTSEEDLSSTTGDRHQISDLVIDSDQGERVVEVYGGVAAHAHAAANAHTIQPVSGGGRSGNGDLLRPQPVDPAHLTSLDLESDNHAHEMLVTDAPHPAHSRHPHDLNHNNPVFSQKPSGRHEERHHASGRAAKYMVSDTSNLGGGLDNFAFDNEIIGQDNYGYDPGYSSERSPEEEEGPPLYYRKALKERQNRALGSSGSGHDRRSLKVGPGEIITTKELMKLFPFISEGTLFEVTVIKNLRGLGLALTGGIECDVPFAGLVRIKKLYPQTPAWLCGQLQVGDIILQANNHQLTGLSSHEALELLRTCGQEVSLEVCRPPEGALGDGEDTPDGCSGRVIVTTSLTAPNTSHNYLSPSPSFSTCGEFEVELTKVAGSLGFTLRKQDNSILGHTIRSLVKEPAISDGRLRPGDKIISVNNTDMCSLSHEEAIAFLRTCPETVTLKLYRDAMQTPISPVSPTEPEIMVKPKALRKEARDMLSDLAFRKQSPCNSPSLAGATSSPGTPRRRRLQKTPSPDIKSVVVDRWDSLVRRTEESLPGSPTLESKISLNSIRETDHEASPFGDSQTDDSASTLRSRNSSSVSSCSLTPSISESSKPKRPSFLDLSSGRSCPRKTQFTPPHEVDQSFPSPLGAQYPSADSIDSAPQLTSTHSDTPAFSHLQQGYHSVNLGALHPHEDSRLTNTTSDHNLSSYDADGPTNNGLLKWKGIVFTPEEEDSNTEESLRDDGSPNSQRSHKPKVVTIELNRGWNSRLGFSLQPKGERTAITAIYADSVAAKDGRLRIGDIVVKVNDVDVVGWDCESVIDLLRKTRGKISLSVIQHPC
ncbi:uncharacterized protein LOC135198224 [Macrobrachium nipponense]|uniref:uncharacterized protein LOC135198224 n=1 Tax=Macrobrachium nipponense TaxID=159736 RepID=UPI0030C8AE6C